MVDDACAHEMQVSNAMLNTKVLQPGPRALPPPLPYITHNIGIAPPREIFYPLSALLVQMPSQNLRNETSSFFRLIYLGHLTIFIFLLAVQL